MDSPLTSRLQPSVASQTPATLKAAQVYDVDDTTYYPPIGHMNYTELSQYQRAHFQQYEYDGSAKQNERMDMDVGRLEFHEGTPPFRVPWLWKDYLGAWAGLAQHGFTQWNYRLYLRPPLAPNVQPRESKSVRGITQRMTTFTGMVRIPSIYVPSSVG